MQMETGINLRLIILTLTILATSSGCQTSPNSESQQHLIQEQIIPVGEYISVDLGQRHVLLQGVTCLDSGWLEQVVCGVGSREHESLVVTSALGSDLHAALLLSGFRPGSPGYWRHDQRDHDVIAVAPTGDLIEIRLLWQDEQGQQQEHPVSSWIMQEQGQSSDHQWVFAGSKLAPPPGQDSVAELYYADSSGSLVGLVTFGDEVIAHRAVVSDQVEVMAPIWSVNKQVVPPVGTPVTVQFKPAALNP